MTKQLIGILGLLETSKEEQKKRRIWNKAQEVPFMDRNVWRRDDTGSLIRYENYGDRSSVYGWEYDHYPIPAMFGGSDEEFNLRPLHHKQNASHGGRLSSLLGAS